MKGISPLISSILLIVITIGIGTVAFQMFAKQATGPLSDSKEQTTTTIDCAQSHFKIISLSLNDDDLVVTLQNTGQKEVSNLLLSADTGKDVLPVAYSLSGSLLPGSVFRLENTTFPYTYSSRIIATSSHCPSIKSEAVLKDASLVGHWKFEDDASDSSSYGNDGTLRNSPAFLYGVYDRAIDLDGTNDYIEVPHDDTLSFSTAFTLSGWVRLPAEMAPNSYWVFASKGTYQNHGWDSFFVNGNATHKTVSIRLNNVAAASNTSTVTTSAISLSNWTHIAIAVNLSDSTHARIYVNGTLSTSGNFSSGYTQVVQNANTLKIGSESSRYTKGTFDEFRFYNRALKEHEVQSIYLSQRLA